MAWIQERNDEKIMRRNKIVLVGLALASAFITSGAASAAMTQQTNLRVRRAVAPATSASGSMPTMKG
jgi:hypothetical protein